MDTGSLIGILVLALIGAFAVIAILLYSLGLCEGKLSVLKGVDSICPEKSTTEVSDTRGTHPSDQHVRSLSPPQGKE